MLAFCTANGNGWNDRGFNSGGGRVGSGDTVVEVIAPGCTVTEGSRVGADGEDGGSMYAVGTAEAAMTEAVTRMGDGGALGDGEGFGGRP